MAKRVKNKIIYRQTKDPAETNDVLTRCNVCTTALILHREIGNFCVIALGFETSMGLNTLSYRVENFFSFRRLTLEPLGKI